MLCKILWLSCILLESGYSTKTTRYAKQMHGSFRQFHAAHDEDCESRFVRIRVMGIAPAMFYTLRSNGLLAFP